MVDDFFQNLGHGLIFLLQATALSSATVRLESSTHKASSIGMGKLSMQANSHRPASRKARFVLGLMALLPAPSRITVPPGSAGRHANRMPPIAALVPMAPDQHNASRASEGTIMDIVQSAPYDLLLRGGRVIDPAQGLDGVLDVAVRDGRLAAVGKNLPGPAKQTVEVGGKLVLPGLIDTHAHVYRYVSGRFGLDADTVGVHSGVTTVVDQGGPSVLTFPGFREYAVKPAATRVLAFISAYMVGGLEGHYYPELYRPDCIAVDDTVRAARENADLVRGVKGHAEIGGFTRWGDEAMRRAAEIGRALDLPLYIHFGQLWPLPEDKHPYDPDAILPEMLKILRPGDILAHPFTRHPGGFVDQHGKVHPVVREALAQGLKTDVGHGSHFSFKMARLVLEAGIVPDTLGADMHGYNTTIPKPRGTPEAHPDKEEMHLFAGAQNFSLASAMTSMLALGLSLEQVVPMVTSNCAAMLGMKDEIGTLRPGVEADVSVLADDSGRFVLKDNEDTQVVADHYIRPVFCLRAGKRFDADSVILPKPLLADAA
jgi:dihydroorotase